MNLSKALPNSRFWKTWSDNGALGTIHGRVPSDREILEWCSDQNILHMQQTEQIDYFIEWLPVTVLATWNIDLNHLGRWTTHWKIGFLEQVRDTSELSDQVDPRLLGEICELLGQVDKEGFRTVDDFPIQMGEKQFSVADVDATLLAAKGDPYGSPPDVASYIRYIFEGRGLGAFLREASQQQLEDVRTLITSKVMDGSLYLASNEMGVLLIGFCASRVAKRLTEITGFEWGAYVVAH